jgi:hypothetical protein
MTPPDASTHALPFPAARRPAARPEPRPATTGLVAERLRARQHRVSQIRRRVAAIAATTFLATSGGIFVQLATGNDPALGSAAAKAAAVTTTAASTSSGSTATTASSGSTSPGTTSGSSSTSSGKATAVTTSQS